MTPTENPSSLTSIYENEVPPDEPAFLADDIAMETIDEQRDAPTIHEEKSSSFPFGTLQSDLTALYDQSSAGGLADAPTNTTDSIDNLLANLAEDNANSLPSVGDEFTLQHITDERKDETAADVRNETHGNNDLVDAASDNSSQPAIAEELPNGNSMDTKNDALDAEMVSEDELPAPEQPQVDDAEEVSDEELPGPKMAELPADTEVVSEDELPASNKVKRKADEGYDPASPTEGTDVPEKRAKIDGNGKSFIIYMCTIFN